MFIHSLKRPFKNLSLRSQILVPFLSLIIFATVIGSVLSLQTGQEAVNGVINLLLDNIISGVQNDLDEILTIPPEITKQNTGLIRLDSLKLGNASGWKHHLLEQIKLHKSIGTIGFGNEEGEAQWIQRTESDAYYIYAIKEASSDSVREQRIDYLGNSIGEPIPGRFNTKTRPWYERAAKNKKPIWSEVYPWYRYGAIDTIIGISYGDPYYETSGKDSSLLGVLVAEPHSSKINDLLQIRLQYTGKYLIIDSSETLIASSFNERLYRLTKIIIGDKGVDSTIVKKVSNITDPLASKAISKLFEEFDTKIKWNSLFNSKMTEPISFRDNGITFLVQTAPLQLHSDISEGIKWLNILIIPKNELIKGFETNTARALLLGVASLVLVIVIGFISSTLITKPIQQVGVAAGQLSKGKWDEKLPNDLTERNNEIGELAKSFNNMRTQLKAFFTNLEKKNKRIKALVEFASHLSSKVVEGKPAIFDFIHSQANKFMDTDNMYIALYDDETDIVSFGLVFVEGKGIDVHEDKGYQPRRDGEGKTEEIIRTKKPLFHATKVEADAWYKKPGRKEYVGKALPSWIGVPMIASDKVIGVIATYHPEDEFVYSRDDLEILQSMADLAAIALENARLYKQAERLRDEKVAGEKLATLGTAMAALQHRISNTFNIITPNLIRLKDRVNLGDKTIAEIFDIIERNARATSDVITRIQEPLREIEAQDIDINTVLVEEIKKAENKWQSDSIIVILKLEDSIPIIRIPIGQVAEVFGNLIDNAFRAMKKKGGQLSIESFLKENNICVRVQDTGPGIPSEVRERLFESPVPAKEPDSSAGLGLWLSQLILRRIGGQITIEKSTSSGTTMLVQITMPSSLSNGGAK